MAAGLRENGRSQCMSYEELRVRYVERLCNNDWSDKGGAGLGLISMAKKSNGPLDYEFNQLESGMFLFTLAVMSNPGFAFLFRAAGKRILRMSR